MALLALLTRDRGVEGTLRVRLEGFHTVACIGRWGRLLEYVRERPAICVVVDEASLPGRGQPDGAVAELRRRFPSVALVWLARRGADPLRLLRLGRAGVDHLLVTPVDDLRAEAAGCVARALCRGTEALVTREVSPYLPPRMIAAVRGALDRVHLRWSTEAFAGSMGLSRGHLSVLLRGAGLPSAGHLLVWARLLHAGRWLADPGRSGQSVARQLEYANGSVFRRALREYTGATPAQVVAGGGLRFVLDRFREECGLMRNGGDRSAA